MQRGLATRTLSIRLSAVPLSHEWIVTKRKKRVPTFLLRMKDHLSQFSEKNMVGGAPLLPEILSQADPVGAKSQIISRYSLIAPKR